jgi:hypothetical protein
VTILVTSRISSIHIQEADDHIGHTSAKQLYSGFACRCELNFC